MNLKLLLAYYKFHFLALFRQPGYVLSSLIFPSLFFLMFALPNADEPRKAHLLMASFAAFGVLGVVILDFGVNVSKERATSWVRYIRTLPVSPIVVFTARSLSALTFSLFASWIVMAVVTFTADTELVFADYARLTGTLLLGSIPFAIFGICIGYWVSANAALPVTNLLYLSVSFAGGIWIPPEGLPESVRKISEFMPTRYYGEMVWSSVIHEYNFDWKWAGYLGIYLAVFLAMALLGYKKDRA
ncbi:MAG: ABC transporter permease [Bdellovibrionales bacterium]|nr:ABC transporter permease [Bdellovibrionales bacterium]